MSSSSSKSSGSGSSSRSGKGGSSSSNSNSGGSQSNYSITKDYGGQKGFMESYGLKMHNDADVQESKAIMDAMREYDQKSK